MACFCCGFILTLVWLCGVNLVNVIVDDLWYWKCCDCITMPMEAKYQTLWWHNKAYGGIVSKLLWWHKRAYRGIVLKKIVVMAQHQILGKLHGMNRHHGIMEIACTCVVWFWVEFVKMNCWDDSRGSEWLKLIMNIKC